MASGSGGQNGGILCIMAYVRVVRMTYRDGSYSSELVYIICISMREASAHA